MSWSEAVVIVFTVAVLGGWMLWVAASRLDRLHRKAMSSRVALDAQLVRRASAALELALSGRLDPASSLLLTDAACAVIDTGDVEGVIAVPVWEGLGGGLPTAQLLGAMDPERTQAESDLSATLRSTLGGEGEITELRSAPGGAGLLAALAGAWFRAQLARRFHNEAVSQAQHVRRKWYVRLFRLAGRAPMPVTVELDDASPPELGRSTMVPEPS